GCRRPLRWPPAPARAATACRRRVRHSASPRPGRPAHRPPPTRTAPAPRDPAARRTRPANRSSLLRPRLERALVEHLDLVFHRLQFVAAKLQQLRAALVAGEQLFQGQLPGLDLADEL